MKCKYLSLLACAGFVALFSTTSTANAKPKPLLDSAQSFAVLGGSAVTLTDSAVIGDVGVVDLNGALTQTTSTISGTVHVWATWSPRRLTMTSSPRTPRSRPSRAARS